jgi:predicted PurR-regulated permease PerM
VPEPNEARLRRWLYGLLVALAAVALLRIGWTALVRVNEAVHVLVIGGVLAFIFEPVVRGLDRILVARAASAAVLAVFLLAIVVGLGGLIGLAAFRQAQSLLAALPGLITAAQNAVPQWVSFLHANGIPFDPNTLLQQALSRFGDIGRGAITYSLAVVGSVVGLVTDLAIGVTIAFYILLDGRRMHEGWMRLVPPVWRDAVAEAEAVALQVLGGFIRGQVTVAVLFGVLVGLGMAWLGLPYPLLLGLQAAFFELLPTIGPFLGAVAPAVLALTLPYPHVLWVLIYFFAVQQLESTFLVPRISGHAVGLHPVAIIVAIVAGFELDGLVGAVAAVPLLGAGYALLRRYAAPWSAERPRRPWPRRP